jgi:NTE family protein
MKNTLIQYVKDTKIYKQEHGAEIKEIYFVKHDEPFPHMYENADYSPEIINNSIRKGSRKQMKLQIK